MTQWHFCHEQEVIVSCVKSVPHWPSDLPQEASLRRWAKTTNTLSAINYRHDVTVLGRERSQHSLVISDKSVKVRRCGVKRWHTWHWTGLIMVHCNMNSGLWVFSLLDRSTCLWSKQFPRVFIQNHLFWFICAEVRCWENLDFLKRIGCSGIH